MTGSATPEVLEGLVELRVSGTGSKAEMESVVLIPDEGEPVVLHLRGREVLSAPAELAAYVGARVRVEGTRAWSSFVVDRVAEV